MSDYDKESELVAYCGIYCRLCDYFTGRIRDSAQNFQEIVKNHSELSIFADAVKTFSFEDFAKGLEWLSNEISPCVGACKGGGGWKDCPIRNCASAKSVRICSECQQFPCEILQKFPNRIEKLNSIKRLGLKAWIDEQLEKP